jgi:DNA adenine methylase Dam
MGNKERLIKKGLIDLFPKQINRFIDLFCGSGIVSMNVNANSYILNDCNETIINLLKYFKENNAEEIIVKMQKTINEHNILKGFNKRDVTETEEYKELAKTNYNKFRSYYNNTDKSILNLYILSYYCNNNNIRFNKSGEFNMPIGNQYFNVETHSKKIVDGCDFLGKDNVYLISRDYKDLKIHSCLTNDFIYMDPPYTNTLAIYNEQQGWNVEDDKKLFDMCEELTRKGIKWAMSNVFENKGVVNQHLKDWVNESNYNVHHFNDFTYVSCGKGNSHTDEVLIMNY